MESLLDKIAERVDSRFLVTLLFPTFVFLLAIGVLVGAQLRCDRVLDWLDELEGSRQVLVFGGAASVWLLLVSILATATHALVRFYEGYWGRGPIGRFFNGIGVRLQKARLKRLCEENSDEAYAKCYYTMPPDGDLLPTQFGNTLRAAESYPGDPERYGVDAVFFWPRLYLILPDTVRTTVGSARADIDRSLLTTTLAALAAASALGFGLYGNVGRETWIPIAVGALIVARLSYGSAQRAAIVFGEILRACFDLYRRPLLTSMGLELPETLEDERRVWTALGQQLYRRGTAQPELLKFSKKPAPPPAEEGGKGEAGQEGE